MLSTGIAWSIKGRYPNKQKELSPGPGNYDTQNSPNKSPSYGMGSAQRSAKINKGDNPGPGAYNPNDQAVKTNPGQSVFTSRHSQKIINKDNPGPGTYQTNQISDKPMWSFGGKSQKGLKANENPGPGAYNPSLDQAKERAKNTVLTSRPKDKSLAQLPGPGEYHQEKESDKPKYSFGIKPKASTKDDWKQGPGQYDPNIKSVKQFYGNTVLTSRPQQKITNQNPGPGTYDQNAISDMPKYSIRGRYNDKQNPQSSIPGPGAYNPTIDQVKENTGTALITSRPTQRQKELSPGPANYNSDLASGAPMYSFRGRQNQKSDKNNIPGPGSYDPKSIKEHQGNIILTSRPNDKKIEQSPGPGTYAYNQLSDQPKYSFGVKTQAIGSKTQAPGPGSYNPSVDAVKQNYGNALFTSRPQDKVVDKAPGPGEYNVQNQEKPRFHIGQKNEQKKVNNNPGPGAYNPSTEFVKEKAGTSLITSRPKNYDTKGNMPGPGTYEANNISDKPKYSFGMKTQKSEKTLNVPGPGAYDANFSQNAPQWSLRGRQEAKHSVAKDNPGPGAYSPAVQSNHGGWKIGEKLKKQEKYNNPGPGAYNPATLQDKKSFSLSGRPKMKLGNQNPAPGAYDPSPVKSNSGFRLGLAKRSTTDRKSAIPGPGSYDTKQNLQGGAKQLLFRFGTEARGKIKQSSNPGPGQYNLEERKTAGFTLGARLEKHNKNDNPGPNSYNPNYSYTKQQYGSISLKGPERGKFSVKKNSNPGPGTYYNPRSDSYPKWKFGTERRDKQPKQEGPGYYDLGSGFSTVHTYRK